nr:hypothetical protein [Tanacetum cinerariifolium]
RRDGADGFDQEGHFGLRRVGGWIFEEHLRVAVAADEEEEANGVGAEEEGAVARGDVEDDAILRGKESGHPIC